MLDITASTTGPQSPLDFAPIDEALFAAFRRFEGALRLDRTPAVQQFTPTVEQFINASAAEYVL